MTKEFQTAYNITVKNEGYLSNHKNDLGGMTWKGIARNMHPNWVGWKEIDKILKGGGGQAQIKVNRSIEEMVQTFYFNEFWNKLRAQEINSEKVRNKLFDTAVNVGIKNAVKFNQRALRIADDGIVSDTFINALNNLR